MASPEEKSYPILRKHDVDYVLVIFGSLLGYSGDDINKFLWMVRIAQGVWPDEIQEPQYFTPRGEYRVDAQASDAMKNSLMYKMSYYRCVLVIVELLDHALSNKQIQRAVYGQPTRRPCAWPAASDGGPNS